MPGLLSVCQSEKMREGTKSPLPRTETIHASCVAIDGQGVLILGGSGSGKSGLALSLLSRGARLISDDKVILTRRGKKIIASAPSALLGLIEARGVGILTSDPAPPVPVKLVVDMDVTEMKRLPDHHTHFVLGQKLTKLHRVESPHFGVAVLQFMRSGRQDPA